MKINAKTIIHYIITIVVVFLILYTADQFSLEKKKKIIFYVAALLAYEIIVIAIDKIGDRISRNKLHNSND